MANRYIFFIIDCISFFFTDDTIKRTMFEFSENDLTLFFQLFSTFAGKKIVSMEDLQKIPASQFLDITEKLPDQLLALLFQVIKGRDTSRTFFDKLMGDHETENRFKVDQFFSRYMKLLVPDETVVFNGNPLFFYLPAETFTDLAFVQSRQNFFLRQTIDTINEYLQKHCNCTHQFSPGEQEEAWQWFWQYLLNH